MRNKDRTETITLIARQIAIFNGVKPDLINKTMGLKGVRENYLSLAENILATVERKMFEYKWFDGPEKSESYD